MFKKFAKKCVGLGVAVVTMMSMSVSAFALSSNHPQYDKGETDCTVTVNLTWSDIDFSGDTVTKSNTTTDSVVVTVKEGSTVEEAVVAAFNSEWEYIDEISATWVSATDYYDSSLVHDALNAVTIDGVEYATETHNTTTQWRGAGWTYSGSDGQSAFNTYNYMCDNTIVSSNATVNLVYDSYVYDM